MNQQNNNNQEVVIPRRSGRLATVIPASNWISMGYSEDDSYMMEKLQHDMKGICDEVGDEHAIIKLEGRSDGALPHHDRLLPHWQKFAKSLNGRTSVTMLKLYGVSLPVSVLDIILPTIQSMDLKVLSLYRTFENCGTGLEGFQRLSTCLKANTSLENLSLGGYSIDMSVANCLSDAIKCHPSIDTIILAQCGINKNADILEIILDGCKRLNQISMAFEELGSASVALTSDFIRSNHSTEIMFLNHANISDNDTLSLASALKKNTKLKELNLRNNNITREGEKALSNALYDPTSMDSIIESNHTCFAYTYDFKNVSVAIRQPPLEREVFNINANDYISVQQKIRKKVILALCGVLGELFDLSHFNDLPLQLMPRVLELIQEHTETRRVNNTPVQLEKDALSRLFHTLRGWELPSLFENLSPNKKGVAGKRKRRKTRR